MASLKPQQISNLHTSSPHNRCQTPQQRPYNEWNVLLVTTLTSVATIIGSGILALPVTLYQTTVPVFVAIFSVCLVAQAAAVYVTVELIQRSKQASSSSDGIVSTTYGATATASSSDNDVENPVHSTSVSSSPSQSQQDQHQQQSSSSYPEISLFTIAKNFLPYAVLRYAFHVFSFLTFISILTSYALAGPQAIWQLFNRPSPTPDPTIVTATAPSTPPHVAFLLFCLIGIVCVVFFMDALLPFFSSLTVVKGALFIAVVLLVVSLPASARLKSLADLLFHEKGQSSSVAVSFLMCTVAIGGLPITIPVTYRLLPAAATTRQVRRYRFAVIAGLLTCFILNIGWVIAILQVVSRTELKTAFENGQITTVPLIESLRSKSLVSPQLLQWVEIIVQLFIIISTIVSFFVMAAGFKNYVEGFAKMSPHTAVHLATYTAAFAPTVALVVSNPKGFITVLTRLCSTTINIQTGFLIFVMLYFSLAQRTNPSHKLSQQSTPEEQPQANNNNNNSNSNSTQNIALPLPNSWMWPAIVLGSLFFGCTSALAAFGPLFGIQLSAS